MNSVKTVANHSLCSACGVCINTCPKNALSLKLNKTYSIDVNENCVDCGICLSICSAVETDIADLYAKASQECPENKIVGNHVGCYNVSATDSALLLNSTSGGFVSATVKKLLDNKAYDCAFLVRGYSYDKLLKAEKITEYSENTAKSRYLSVSMESLVKEMLNNRDEKIIICATPCAVQALLNVISKYKLNRNNYLILGLFCDNTQSYEINEYFSSLSKNEISELYFRDKTQGGWPGNVKLVYKNGTSKHFEASKRKNVKKYYKLKRCFTCFDKLNCFADISVGDNYTKSNRSNNGSNSIIIRTQAGLDVFESVKDLFNVNNISIDDIVEAQSIKARERNLINASIVSAEDNITIYTEPVPYTDSDVKTFHDEFNETKKGLECIKKEVRKKEISSFIKKIKRKLRIK